MSSLKSQNAVVPTIIPTLDDFEISEQNILDFFNDCEYVYSQSDNRIYKKISVIIYDNIVMDKPSIMVDRTGDSCEFRYLIAENTFSVTKCPKFDYIKYSYKWFNDNKTKDTDDE